MLKKDKAKKPLFIISTIVMIALLLSGCNSVEDKPDETIEMAATYTTGNATLRLIDREGNPIEGVKMFVSDLPEESLREIERTDSEGKTQWTMVKTGTQNVSATVDDKRYTFEGEIRESDFNTTITLQIAKENKMYNGYYRFLRDSDEKIPVNTEGSAASFLSAVCPAADAQSLTYEQAIKDKRLRARMASQEQIGPYAFTRIEYTEKSDTLIYFATDESIKDGMVHEKILVESSPLADHVNAAEMNEKYLSLAQVQKEGISSQLIDKWDFSVFTDGYEINCMSGGYLYHIIVNGDKELLQDTIALLK